MKEKGRLKTLEDYDRTTDLIWQFGSAISGGGIFGLITAGEIGAGIGVCIGIFLVFTTNRRKKSNAR